MAEALDRGSCGVRDLGCSLLPGCGELNSGVSQNLGQDRRDGPYWHAYITREDSEGLSWHTSIGAMVVNDFGGLVRVAKG